MPSEDAPYEPTPTPYEPYVPDDAEAGALIDAALERAVEDPDYDGEDLFEALFG